MNRNLPALLLRSLSLGFLLLLLSPFAPAAEAAWDGHAGPHGTYHCGILDRAGETRTFRLERMIDLVPDAWLAPGPVFLTPDGETGSTVPTFVVWDGRMVQVPPNEQNVRRLAGLGMWWNALARDIDRDGSIEFIVGGDGSPPKIVSHDLSTVAEVQSGRPSAFLPPWEVTVIAGVADLVAEAGLEILAGDEHFLDLYGTDGRLLARTNVTPHVSGEGVVSGRADSVLVPRSDSFSSDPTGRAVITEVSAEPNPAAKLNPLELPYRFILKDIAVFEDGLIRGPIIEHDLDDDGHQDVLFDMTYETGRTSAGPGFFVIDGRSGKSYASDRIGSTMPLSVGSVLSDSSTIVASYNSVSPGRMSPGIPLLAGEIRLSQYRNGSVSTVSSFPMPGVAASATLCDIQGDERDEFVVSIQHHQGHDPTGTGSRGEIQVRDYDGVIWNYSLEVGWPYAVTIGDLENDGNLELLFTTSARVGYIFTATNESVDDRKKEWTWLLDHGRIGKDRYADLVAQLSPPNASEARKAGSPMGISWTLAVLVVSVYAYRRLDRASGGSI